ncbi:unnamed protein product [Adineta steineri]|uniref:Uncharacterized protein n=1 Tax=Adineta steineri TaxID=433720 RepID=A0A814KVG5_9BILA|nr:unnamed protein product [Adineta steineri]
MNRFIGYLFILLIIKTKNVDSLYAKDRSRFSNNNAENLSDELPELWITFPGFSSNVIRTLTNEKVQNPGVREVVCQIILENNFSLTGIQEIGNKEALGYIVEEFNNAIIPLIKDWHNRQNGKWNYTVNDAADRMFQVRFF